MNALLLAAEEGNGPWLPHDLNEVYWGTIAFLIVFGLLAAWMIAGSLHPDLGVPGAQRARARRAAAAR